MSIGKRFFIFLFVESLIAVAMFVAIMTVTLRESPALVQKTGKMQAEIVAQFTALGYEEDHIKWIRMDPLGNVDSRMGLSFNVHGNLESISCEAGYINTQSADAIYSDMEATVRAMGDSLDSKKYDIMQVIDEIKNDRFAHTTGKLEHIRWKIESNTYSDGQGGKVRYVCFTANARFEDSQKNWLDNIVDFMFG